MGHTILFNIAIDWVEVLRPKPLKEEKTKHVLYMYVYYVTSSPNYIFLKVITSSICQRKQKGFIYYVTSSISSFIAF